jgi:hypothetical protein
VSLLQTEFRDWLLWVSMFFGLDRRRCAKVCSTISINRPIEIPCHRGSRRQIDTNSCWPFSLTAGELFWEPQTYHEYSAKKSAGRPPGRLMAHTQAQCQHASCSSRPPRPPYTVCPESPLFYILPLRCLRFVRKQIACFPEGSGMYIRILGSSCIYSRNAATPRTGTD